MEKDIVIKEEVVKNVMDDYINNQNEKKKLKEEMFSNYDYFNWLEEFSLRCNSFTDDQFDDVNVKKLYLLYEAIADYKYSYKAFEAIPDDMSCFYRVIYNGSCYEIGNVCGQGSFYFCTRCSYNEKNYYVDLNEVYIWFKMNYLCDGIINFYKKGYEPDVILNNISDLINKKDVKSVKILKK